ncbi:MAG: hypothetical protein NUV80_01845 [Candidatus Berkelbacteria bacterium]|nr:hypothetical protein [Candidatus Berkelbacteria bacterium]MCR4307279.1 hypothetical protein [Candidatus Berkelbacteria bacterium]
MSKTVRIILIIAFIIFVAGITWAIIATRNNKKDTATKTANTPTLVGTPSSTTTPAVTTPATTTPSTPTPPVSKPAPKKPAPKYRIVFTEETTEEVSASAWASAGTNADGSAWAYAYAE